VERTLAHGGLVSRKSNADGTQGAYELNINYFDALSNPHADEPLDTQVDRFIAAHAIMLALVGVPGIYFHSMFGSRGWRAGVAQTGQHRTINREKLARAVLERELSATTSRRHHVFARFKQLLQVRAAYPAFHPYGEQRIASCGDAIFAVERISLRGDERVLCLHNVSNQAQPVEVDTSEWHTDLITRLEVKRMLQLAPYQVLWLIR